MSFDHLWAGWRTEYVSAAGSAGPDDDGCVFCRILGSDSSDESVGVVWRSATGLVVGLLNAYPYTSGHLMVMPTRHVGELEQLTDDESTALWRASVDAVRALKAAYSPDGVNVGANLGRSAGAGIPGHVHLHVLPRWNGDTNFMTTVAGVRVMPESLDATWEKLSRAWRSLPTA